MIYTGQDNQQNIGWVEQSSCHIVEVPDSRGRVNLFYDRWEHIFAVTDTQRPVRALTFQGESEENREKLGKK